MLLKLIFLGVLFICSVWKKNKDGKLKGSLAVWVSACADEKEAGLWSGKVFMPP